MNLRHFGQPWIPTGERSGLQTRIATTFPDVPLLGAVRCACKPLRYRLPRYLESLNPELLTGCSLTRLGNQPSFSNQKPILA